MCALLHQFLPRMLIFVIYSLLLLPSNGKSETKRGEDLWKVHTYNISQYDKSKSPVLQSIRLTGFYPLGFSKDGWFAYFHHPEVDGNPETLPIFSQGISLINIRCLEGGECVTDSPVSKGDVCYCPPNATFKELSRYHIHLLKDIQHGLFPAKIEDDEYWMEIVYKEDIIPSEMLDGGNFPGTEVYLVSKKHGKKLITVIDHNHSGAAKETVQANVWMETPIKDTIIVLVSYAFTVSPSQQYVVSQPVATDLKASITSFLGL